MKRLLRIDPRIVDWLLGIALGVAAVVQVLTVEERAGSPLLNALLVGLIGPAAIIRRRHPVLAGALWALPIVALGIWLTPPTALNVPFFGVLIFPFYIGLNASGRRTLAGPVLTFAAVSAVALTAPGGFIWGDIFFPGTFGTMFWLAGRAMRSRGRLTAELHEAAVRADERREAEQAQAIAEERRRIAREMHDVVAHSVSTMVIQAGGARRILALDPQRAVDAAELIERTGREALREMRHLLGVLHAGEEHPELAPQPTLQGLEALVERSRAAGLPVELEIEGERRELPAGLDLAAYRVIQEALTNALKHGGGAPAQVLVRYADDELELTVSDRGRGGAAARVEGGGHGLVGMRERVRVFGGELHAGRRDGGGFEVRARLPLLNEDEAALAASAAEGAA